MPKSTPRVRRRAGRGLDAEGTVFHAFRGSTRLTARRVIVAACMLEVGACAAIYAYERLSLRSARDQVVGGAPPAHVWHEFAVPGVAHPVVVAAVAAELKPDEPVVGVVVDGKARAYRLAALTDRFHHVVNDVVGEVPVSIAYCDLSDCVRGYTRPRGASPLDVSVAGLYDGAMVVSLGGVRVLHATGEPFRPAAGSRTVPYDRLEPTRTTWRAWRDRHPETDVYQGDVGAAPVGRP